MKHLFSSYKVAFLLGALFISCQSPRHKAYSITEMSSEALAIDSSYDDSIDKGAKEILDVYSQQVHKKMNTVIGVSEQTMINAGPPENLLSNLVADVLRKSTFPYIKKYADIGLVNQGGLRNTLTKGNITIGNIYEILPFENSLTILTLKGKDLKQLLEVVGRRGEGISNAKIVLDKNKKVQKILVGNHPIDKDKDYVVATIDYLAEGNSDMTPLLKATHSIAPEGATLRDLMLRYIKNETKNKRSIHSQIDYRIIIKK